MKYTEAILSGSTRKLLWFEITKTLIAVTCAMLSEGLTASGINDGRTRVANTLLLRPAAVPPAPPAPPTPPACDDDSMSAGLIC